MFVRKANRCKRGHLVTGDNVRRRPSTKYVACRECERHNARKNKVSKGQDHGA